jgi:hypothetical protein
MFGWIVTLGVPFLAASLSNRDGTTITFTVTVTDNNGRFSTVIVNGSALSTRIVYYDPDRAEVTIPAGTTNIGTGGPRRWPLNMAFCSAA